VIKTDPADDALNLMLDRAGMRLCAVMLSHGVPRTEIVAVLDGMADALEIV
jgi:hypothetical protein